MNGEPLPPDHGFPARLVVPGWIGIAIDQVARADRGVRPAALLAVEHHALPAGRRRLPGRLAAAHDPGREERVRAALAAPSLPAGREPTLDRALVVGPRPDPARRGQHRPRRHLGRGRRVRQERPRAPGRAGRSGCRDSRRAPTSSGRARTDETGRRPARSPSRSTRTGTSSAPSSATRSWCGASALGLGGSLEHAGELRPRPDAELAVDVARGGTRSSSTLRKSAAAVSRFVAPPATSAATCSSCGVRASSLCCFGRPAPTGRTPAARCGRAPPTALRRAARSVAARPSAARAPSSGSECGVAGRRRRARSGRARTASARGRAAPARPRSAPRMRRPRARMPRHRAAAASAEMRPVATRLMLERVEDLGRSLRAPGVAARLDQVGRPLQQPRLTEPALADGPLDRAPAPPSPPRGRRGRAPRSPSAAPAAHAASRSPDSASAAKPALRVAAGTRRPGPSAASIRAIVALREAELGPLTRLLEQLHRLMGAGERGHPAADSEVELGELDQRLREMTAASHLTAAHRRPR